MTPASLKKIKLTSENKCSFCVGSKCCLYVTESIVTPRSIEDFDQMLWQVSHKHTHIFKDGDGWYLLFLNECQHLQDDGRCGIYEVRPKMCREHTNDFCEYDVSIEENSELYFKDYESMDAYCRKRFKTWDKRFDNF